MFKEGNNIAVGTSIDLSYVSAVVQQIVVDRPQHPRDHTTTTSWIAQEALLRSTFMGRGTMGRSDNCISRIYRANFCNVALRNDERAVAITEKPVFISESMFIDAFPIALDKSANQQE